MNWFRKNDGNRFLWPGYGENSRVLKWICERVDGAGKAKKTPIGQVPTPDALDVGGLGLAAEDLKLLLEVDVPGWRNEAADVAANYAKFGNRLPAALNDQLNALKQRLG